MAQAGAQSKRRTVATGAILRYGLIAIAIFLALTGVIYASQRFEQFLIRDPRFFLPGPADYGMESPNVALSGVKYASRARVLGVFEQDYGRSLYLFPLAARRKALMNVSWVHEASVARIWPNRVAVSITERKPAAFMKIPSGGIMRWALIDEEGVILDPPPKAPFKLPVLTGTLAAEPQEKRARRVRRMQRLMTELGPLADKVSEVDVSDLDDLKISEQMQGRAVTLLLGGGSFFSRVKNFHEHYQDIHKKVPKATTFDLRLDDRITGLEDEGRAR